MEPATDLTLIVVLPITILFWGFVVWMILQWRKMKYKSELQHKIVDKFSSVQEFNEFLQSQEGKRFLAFLKFNGAGLRGKLMSSLSLGVIVLFLGVGSIVVAGFFEGVERYFLAGGIVLFLLGVGFVISTFLSYKLSRKWGLLERNGQDS